jgi:hypothetical protein
MEGEEAIAVRVAAPVPLGVTVVREPIRAPQWAPAATVILTLELSRIRAVAAPTAVTNLHLRRR